MGRAQALAGAAVKVFVELEEISPVRITLKWTVGRKRRHATLFVAAVDY